MISNLELDTIIEAWSNKIELDFDDTVETFNLYIDNPFCKSKCRFCCYMPSILTDKTKPTFDTYYSEYLPNCINDYSPIFKIKTPNTVYFGGGTSSLMDENQMECLFTHLNQKFDFRNGQIEKTFEMNPLDVTEKKIDILSEWNFTHITLGIQSFNQDVLRHNNRKIFDIDEIFKIARILENSKIIYNMDMMAFIYNNDLSQDLEILSSDLKILASQIKPKHITIYPNYFFIDPPENREKGLLAIKEKRKLINRYLCENGGYTESNNLSNLTDLESIKQTYRYGHSLLRNDLVGVNHWKLYSCSGWPNSNVHQNVLGIGGFGRRKTYSYFGNKFCYKTSFSPVNHEFELVYADPDY